MASLQCRAVAVVPVERCLSGRDLSEPRLTADGARLGYVLSQQGHAEVVMVDLASGEQRSITGVVAPRPGRGLGGGCWCWSADEQAIVYAAGDGNLWWQQLDGAPARQLTAQGPERVAQAPAVVPDGSRVVYVVEQAEVWSVSLIDGTVERLDDGSADFCFDPFPTPCSSGVLWLAWNVPDMPWDHTRVVNITFADMARSEWVPEGSVQQPRTLPDGRGTGIVDAHGWNNLWVDGEVVVDEPFEHGGPTWGLGQRSYACSPDGQFIAFTRNEAGFGRLCVVELASGQVREQARGVHGQLSWAGDRLAALRTGARTPTQVVVYDTSGGPSSAWPRHTVAVGPDASWADDDLVEPEAITITAADGSTVFARLYRAAPSDAPPRMICWVHGGPTDQWQVTFMPRIAYWRSRGWNIVVPDHRGSTGHGRAYQQALNGRWGELDVSDVVATIRHAHEAGWATPATTALNGGSAGGFTVLGVLRDAPELVAAAVVAYPVADLADLAERSHRFERHSTLTLVGDPAAPGGAERYLERSPVWFTERITTPLLVFHGEDDPVVPVGQSRLLVERIRPRGSEVQLLVYPAEGHGFRQRVNQLDEYARTEAFLHRHVP